MYSGIDAESHHELVGYGAPRGGEARSTGCQGWIKVMTLYLMEIRVHTRQSKLWPFIWCIMEIWSGCILDKASCLMEVRLYTRQSNFSLFNGDQGAYLKFLLPQAAFTLPCKRKPRVTTAPPTWNWTILLLSFWWRTGRVSLWGWAVGGGWNLRVAGFKSSLRFWFSLRFERPSDLT